LANQAEIAWPGFYFARLQGSHAGDRESAFLASWPPRFRMNTRSTTMSPSSAPACPASPRASGWRTSAGGVHLRAAQHAGGLNSFYSIAGRKFDVGLHAMTNFVRPG
jgi:hypothetical protein